MDLRQWLQENGLSQAEFGKQLKPAVSHSKVAHWLSGARRVSLAEALQIERLTAGKVTLAELAALHRRRGALPMKGQPHAECASEARDAA